MKLYLIRHAESEANAASDLDNQTIIMMQEYSKRS